MRRVFSLFLLLCICSLGMSAFTEKQITGIWASDPITDTDGDVSISVDFTTSLIGGYAGLVVSTTMEWDYMGCHIKTSALKINGGKWEIDGDDLKYELTGDWELDFSPETDIEITGPGRNKTAVREKAMAKALRLIEKIEIPNSITFRNIHFNSNERMTAYCGEFKLLFTRHTL